MKHSGSLRSPLVQEMLVIFMHSLCALLIDWILKNENPLLTTIFLR